MWCFQTASLGWLGTGNCTFVLQNDICEFIYNLPLRFAGCQIVLQCPAVSCSVLQCLKIYCKPQFFSPRVRRELGRRIRVFCWSLPASLLVYYPWHFKHWFQDKIFIMAFLLYMMQLSPGWDQWAKSLTHWWTWFNLWQRTEVDWAEPWDTAARLSCCWLPTSPSHWGRVWMFVSKFQPVHHC